MKKDASFESISNGSAFHITIEIIISDDNSFPLCLPSYVICHNYPIRKPRHSMYSTPSVPQSSSLPRLSPWYTSNTSKPLEIDLATTVIMVLLEIKNWGHSLFPAQRHKGGALMFSLICAWINGWVNNREAGDLKRHHAHYDVTVMLFRFSRKFLMRNPCPWCCYLIVTCFRNYNNWRSVPLHW